MPDQVSPVAAARFNPRALVREDAVHRAVYTDPNIFNLEMERLFGRAWIYLAHESEIKAPGDYVVRHIGTQALIVTRGEDGRVHAVVNRCTHRGATLCAFDRGAAPEGHRCPYHGWLFGPDGALKSVPYKSNYENVLRFEEHGLQRAPRLESYRGFIFGSLAEAGPGLVDFLGHMASSIDDLVDRSPSGEVECSPYVLRHYYRANWKMTFENLNDTIHPGFAHASSVRSANAVADEVGGRERLAPTLGMMIANGKPITFFQKLDMITAPHGHSYIGGHMGADYSPDTQGAYFKALAQRHGPARASEILRVDRHLTLLYPSSTWHARYQTVRIVRPVRHDLTEVIGYTFAFKGAPDELRVNAIEYCNGANSAASPVISDDLELYERCLAGNEMGANEWVPMSRGLKEVRARDNGFTQSPATSEIYIRNQFAAWAALMEQAQ